MMHHLTTLFSAVLLLLATLNFTKASSNTNTKQPENEGNKKEQDSKTIESYWTEENMKSAEPIRAQKIVPQPGNIKSQSKPDPMMDKNKIE